MRAIGRSPGNAFPGNEGVLLTLSGSVLAAVAVDLPKPATGVVRTPRALLRLQVLLSRFQSSSVLGFERSVRPHTGERPPLRGYSDDIDRLVQSVSCA